MSHLVGVLVESFETPFSGSDGRMTHLPKKVTSPGSDKRLRTDLVLFLVRRSISTLVASLADDDAEQNISRAYVPYAPLYPTFQESLNRFQRGERSELLHRGAERIVHNVGLYDTRRSSEDRGVDIPVILEEAVPPVLPRNV